MADAGRGRGERAANKRSENLTTYFDARGTFAFDQDLGQRVFAIEDDIDRVDVFEAAACGLELLLVNDLELECELWTKVRNTFKTPADQWSRPRVKRLTSV